MCTRGRTRADGTWVKGRGTGGFLARASHQLEHEALAGRPVAQPLSGSVEPPRATRRALRRSRIQVGALPRMHFFDQTAPQLSEGRLRLVDHRGEHARGRAQTAVPRPARGRARLARPGVLRHGRGACSRFVRSRRARLWDRWGGKLYVYLSADVCMHANRQGELFLSPDISTIMACPCVPTRVTFVMIFQRHLQ